MMHDASNFEQKTKNAQKKCIAKVALPSPLRSSFDYLVSDKDAPFAKPGHRLLVDFNNRKTVGIILLITDTSEVPREKLKTALALLDQSPLLPEDIIGLIEFASTYYQHAIGETYQIALPSALRKGKPLLNLNETRWQLTDNSSPDIPKRAKAQLKAADALKNFGSLNEAQLKQQGINKNTLNALLEKAIIEQYSTPPTPQSVTFAPSGIKLDDQQTACLEDFHQRPKGYYPVLLEGVTGSGKTEVYLQMVETTLKQKKQVLILVPEIGLTPQTLGRFERRFQTPLAVFHSDISEKKKLEYWQKAKDGIAPIIIGTRSAIFTPIQNLGLIIIDEEHDLSYKQQDTLRYNAKDLACVRAQHHQIPVILGSATPSLESLYNSESKKFTHWLMEKRAGQSQKAAIDIFDIKQAAMHEGIAEELLPRIDDTLKRGEQVLLFINRRGFAPTLICHDCGWIHHCHACDARMTIHRQAAKSQCHHCGAIEWTPIACPECKSTSLESVGVGTERLTLFMQQQFQDTPCYRIDRDTTGSKGQIDEVLESIKNQQRAILIGTQMLAKGHHLPNVTLVIIVDADHGLMGADFRSLERFGQLVTQVIGRAGRGDKKGTAIIQTHYPEHEQLQKLIHFGYRRFAMDILSERKQLGLPPFQHLALIRLEAQDQQEAIQILTDMIQQTAPHYSQVIGPFSAGLARRAHFFRFQVAIKATSRGARAHTVNAFLAIKDKLIKARHRFSIDIDPQDMA